MYKRHSWLAIIVFVALSAPGFGANHYIRAGATGSQTGSDWANACSGFTGLCAASSLVRGDTYYVADGSYGSYTFNRPVSGTSLITIKKATVSDHGTSAGWNDSYGDGVASFNGQINFTSSNWVFDGVSGGGPGSWTSGFGFRISQTSTVPLTRVGSANNITIRHVELVGNGNANGGGSIAQDGLAMFGGTNVTISYFSMNNLGRCPFFIVQSSSAFVAEYGYIGTFISTAAQHSEIASIWDRASNMTFRHNLFRHSAGTGGLIFEGTGMYVYGNVFYRAPGEKWSGGNGLIGSWTVSTINDVRVYNNAFINVNIPTLGTLFRSASGNIAYNNLFYNSGSPSFALFGMHDYNAFYDSGGSAGESNSQVGTGDPFVSSEDLDFRLVVPTRTGIPLPAPYDRDPDGVTRGSSGVWNRGAFQSTGASSSRPAPPTGLLSSLE